MDENLQNELKVHWSGLFSSRKRFNEYEYKKHGSCMDPYKGKIEAMPELMTEEIRVWRE